MTTQPQKKQKLKHAIQNNLYMLRMIHEICPKLIPLSFLVSFAGFFMWAFSTIIFTQYIFGSADMDKTFGEVLLFLIVYAALNLIIDLLQGWFYQRYRPMHEPEIYYKMHLKLFEKANNADVGCFENAEYFNSYTKAANEAAQRAMSVVYNCSTAVSALLSFLYVTYVMFTINALIGLTAFIPIINHLFISTRVKKLEYDRKMEQVPHERRQAYTDRVFYLQQYAKELRLTGVSGVLQQEFNHSTSAIIRIIRSYQKRLALLTGLRSVFCFQLMFEGSWFIGLILVMITKTISVSDFAVIVNAVVSMSWMMMDFSNALSGIFEDALYTDNLKTFLNYQSNIPEDWDGLDVPEQVQTLELRDVSFHYQGGDRDVVRHLNLTLSAGQIISLVGNNGSGKSTLVKLIMRLYDPTGGVILLNGVDIRKFNLKQYRALIGATFQDFQIFSLSVSDNVTMGNQTYAHLSDPAADALRQSGAYDRICQLPDNMQTTLTKEFDDEGINLSIGEAQKVAIARAFAKRACILLLDEPSSALDPIAEHTMFENFYKLCKGCCGPPKLSLFISHRLSSATVADCVYLMQNGEIIESGAHAQLLAQNGVYTEMFRRQAEHYALGGDVHAAQ